MNYIKLLHTIRRHGTSYAIATMFFSKKVRDKVLLLYSFVRKPDNIVDQDLSNLNQEQRWLHYQKIKLQLQSMLLERKREYQEWVSDYAGLFLNNNIPFEYSQCFFEAMIDDCDHTFQMTYGDLQRYMYGSATVVGFMMNCVLWVNDHAANEHVAWFLKYWIRGETQSQVQIYAKHLAEAMQLTNFLRDIKEDYIQLNRIYIPLDIQKMFEVDLIEITHYCKTTNINYESIERKNFVSMMKYLIEKCRTLYREAERWYFLLPQDSVNAVRLSWILYEGILDKIENNNYDVFTKSARTTLIDKYMIIRKWKLKNQGSLKVQLSYEEV